MFPDHHHDYDDENEENGDEEEYVSDKKPTLDCPFEECLAGLTGGDPIVEARGNVPAHQTTSLRLLLLVLDQLRIDMMTTTTVMMMMMATMAKMTIMKCIYMMFHLRKTALCGGRT